MRQIIYLNHDWDFTEQFDEQFANGQKTETTTVDLPHTCKETPFNYFDESIYQMVCGYRRKIKFPDEVSNKRIFLVIGAAGHSAQVFVDGKPCGNLHKGGYTGFSVELTDFVQFKKEVLLAIKVDSREQQNIPPFGHVIDYMTYGGLYREVWLEIREQSYIEDVFAKPDVYGKLESIITVEGSDASKIRQTLFLNDKEQCSGEFNVGDTYMLTVSDVKLWDIDNPVLYKLRTELMSGDVQLDSVDTVIGFRSAKFESDGFYLNGKKTKIVGLNRHQSYAYVGYAMPKSMQQLDADILKHELGVNAVRTSHYPQSQHFINRCDELGLLVFTEIPGWQHIGDEEWKEVAVQTTAEMVRQYRNHPSIILWGVRINESVDDDEFYKRTNAVARELDSTRQTGGVRCHKKSNLLEDVYTYNDFVHEGNNCGCEPKASVTSNMNKAYLISEYNGHMYPAKVYDDEEQRLEHALRHARVLDSVAKEDDIAGSFGWCFFDYNTHKDFGSGDRVCYHGVTDMFRNPKLASAVYAAMQDNIPVLSVSSSMDIGEHPAGNRGRVYLFTNADTVRFYKNDRFIREFTKSDSEYKYIKSPPIEVNDFLGEQIIENEDFKPRQAQYVKDILNESTRFGMSNLSLKAKLKAAWLMLRYRMSFGDAYALYGKYIGNWGGESTLYRFDAIKNSKVVKKVCKGPFESRRLEIKASHTILREHETYDVASIRICMTDQNGNVLPFYNGVLRIETEGPIKIIGPKNAMLQGGMGGIYIRTIGKSGKALVTIFSENTKSMSVELTVEADKEE